MLSDHTGELAALLTAVCWTGSAIAFESASRKIGSVAVNFIRLIMAFLFISIYNYFISGFFFPVGAGYHQWLWLSVSGVIGFVIGDLFLFKSFTLIGSRISLLIMTLVPPVSGIAGWILLGEKLSWFQIAGMSLTISGIILVLLKKEKGGRHPVIALPLKGVLFAVGGAIGQAFGLVLSKYGMKDYDPVSSTQIRIFAGIIGFALVVVAAGRIRHMMVSLKNLPAMGFSAIGAFFGPFIGVTSSLYAVQHTSTGIASTLMAITPILIIPPSVLFFGQKITLREIAGTVISFAGVIIFFL